MIYRWQKQDACPQKLGNFLGRQGFSKTQLKKLRFHQGQVYVNHHRRYFNYLLQQNDEIHVVLPQEKTSTKIQPLTGPVSVLYEDDNYLLVNKPAGLASLPVMNINSATLANYVKSYLQASQANNDVIHLVSRLDRDTSGIVTFAKNAYAHSLLASEFQTTAITKEYDALVQGKFSQDQLQGQICAPIGVDCHNHNLRCVTDQGKWSVTKYRVIRQYSNFTWVKVQLVTGRTHQIRVHFAYLGHPLVGDEAYGGRHDLLSRQALHCCRISFLNQPVQKRVTVRAPLPLDLKKLLHSED